jgi:hypothetical protein
MINSCTYKQQVKLGLVGIPRSPQTLLRKTATISQVEGLGRFYHPQSPPTWSPGAASGRAGCGGWWSSKGDASYLETAL